MPPALRIRDWRLDPLSHELRHDGDSEPGSVVHLAEKPFRVLQALIEARGEVVTRRALQKLLWPDDTFVDFDNNLNSAVATLRQALGDSARSPRYIETIPKVGYRLVGKAAQGHASAVRPGAVGRFRWRAAPVLVVAALLIAFGLPFVLVPRAPRPSPVPAAASSVDPEARTLFSRGTYLRQQFLSGATGAETLAQARDAFRRAAEIDPAFAAALAEEADTLVEMSFAGTVAFPDGLTAARGAAERALAADPQSATAQRVLGVAGLFLDWDFTAAGRRLDAAAAADPTDARTLLAQAMLAGASGRHDEAVRLAEAAVAADPASRFVRADLSMFYLAAGRYEDAERASRDVLAVAPDFPPALAYLVLANERLGRWREAAAVVPALIAAAGGSMDEISAAGPRELVERWHHWQLRRLESRAAARVDDYALQLALEHATAGDRDHALDYLERALARRNPLLAFLRSFPELAELRGDPRFERIASRLQPRKG